MAKRKIVLTQNEMKTYYNLRMKRLKIMKDVRELEKQEDEVEEILKTKLRKRVKKESGDLVATLEEGSRFPAWKKEFVARLGEDVAEEVLENTPAREKLVVKYVSKK
jgi:hypothetical protein